MMSMKPPDDHANTILTILPIGFCQFLQGGQHFQQHYSKLVIFAFFFSMFKCFHLLQLQICFIRSVLQYLHLNDLQDSLNNPPFMSHLFLVQLYIPNASGKKKVSVLFVFINLIIAQALF